MPDGLHHDPTFNAAVRMEVREKKGCGVCVRRREVLGALMCSENKKYPFCKQDKKGFVYDEGEF